MNTPLSLLEVFLHLKQSNSTSYLVGGCVRDYLLGKNPNDFDIATDANLEDVMNLSKIESIDSSISISQQEY